MFDSSLIFTRPCPPPKKNPVILASGYTVCATHIWLCPSVDPLWSDLLQEKTEIFLDGPLSPACILEVKSSNVKVKNARKTEIVFGKRSDLLRTKSKMCKFRGGYACCTLHCTADFYRAMLCIARTIARYLSVTRRYSVITAKHNIS